MPSPTREKALLEEQPDRISPAEAYAISVISRTPAQDRKAVADRFEKDVFSNNPVSRERIRECESQLSS